MTDAKPTNGQTKAGSHSDRTTTRPRDGNAGDRSVRQSLATRVRSLRRTDLARVAVALVVLSVVAPFVVFAVPQVVGADQSYVVLSGSMEPAIPTGSVVVVAAVAPETVETGDVITYGGSATEPTTTHRVVDIGSTNGQRWFRTKGDNNEDPDPRLVPADALVGQVLSLPIPGVGPTLFVIPLIGYVIQFAQTTVGFGLLVVVPFALLATAELRAYLRRDEERESEATAVSAAVDDTAAEADADHDSDAETAETDLLALRVEHVTVGVGLLSGASVFVGQRAVATESPLLAMGAVGTLTVAVLLCLLVAGASSRRLDASPADSQATADTTADAPAIVDSSLSHLLEDRPHVRVDSQTTLSRLASKRQTAVIRDVDQGILAVVDDALIYVLQTTDSAVSTPFESSEEMLGAEQFEFVQTSADVDGRLQRVDPTANVVTDSERGAQE